MMESIKVINGIVMVAVEQCKDNRIVRVSVVFARIIRKIVSNVQ